MTKETKQSNMGTGFVYLYDGEEQVKGKRYTSMENRKQILRYWRQEIGPLIKKMTIQICPHVNLHWVEKNGENANKAVTKKPRPL